MKELNFRIQKEDNLNSVIYDDTPGPGNGRHTYIVLRGEVNDGIVNTGDQLAFIHFQEGPRNEENSIAGVLETDLLEIVRHRLQCFQAGQYATRENACALTHIEEALMWLNKRVADRKERGVLGKNEK